MTRERRRSKRWLHEEEVLCYFQGDRLGAFSKDLSRSGMFLGTAMEVPIDGRVALIFKQRFAEETPIYLVGRVVRHQAEPVPGLGIQWIKAITDASPRQLSNFLKSTLDVDAGEDVEEIDYETGAVSNYSFKEAPKSGGRPKTEKKRSALELLDRLNAEAKSTEEHDHGHAEIEGHPTEPAPRPRPPARKTTGPITMRVDNQKVYAPCKIPGTLVISGVQTEITIRGLATWGLFVETETTPPVGMEVGMIFDLRTKSGDARLVLRCDVEAQKKEKKGWAAGLDLKITNPGDPLGTALLTRYVRWLHFRAVAAD